MTVSIVFFLLFLLPLLVVPFGYSYFELPKVICAQILIEILVILKIFKAKLPLKLLIPISILGLLTIYDLLFLRTQTTFWGNIFRFQGVFMLWHLLLLALISSRIKLPKISYLFYLVPLFGLLASSYILGKNDAGRSFGTLGEPNALAASTVFLLPFLYFASGKIVRVASLILIIWIILLSGSRAGLVAFAIQVFFLISTKWFSLKKVVLICLAFLALSFTFPFIEGGGWYENRAQVWQTAIVAGFINPLFGSGFGNIEEILPKTSEIINNNVHYQYTDSSHNFLLDYWVTGGLIGVLTLCFLLFQAIKNFISRGKKLELAALLGLITVMSFNPVSVVTLAAFWWLIGQGF